MYSFNDITAKGRLGKMGHEMICLDTHDTRIKRTHKQTVVEGLQNRKEKYAFQIKGNVSQ